MAQKSEDTEEVVQESAPFNEENQTEASKNVRIGWARWMFKQKELFERLQAVEHYVSARN